jgi:hypothetical protein
MNTHSNMLSQKSDISCYPIKNKGFVLLDSLFRESGWHIIKNEENWLVYTKKGFETEYIEIKIAMDSILVSIPIKNSPFQFKTSFSNYFQASEYVEARFIEFIM